MNKLIQIKGFEMYKCPSCNRNFFRRDLDNNYCTYCGEPLKEGITRSTIITKRISRRNKLFMSENYDCGACGKCQDYSLFCCNCGAKFIESEEV